MPGTSVALTGPRIIASRSTGYFDFPDLLAFPDGRLMATATKVSDSYFNAAIVSGVFTMTNANAVGVPAYDSDRFFAAAGEPTIAVGDTIVGFQYNVIPTPNNGTPVTTFLADRMTWSNGGAVEAKEALAVSISGFPSAIKPIAGSTSFYAYFQWFGKVIRAADNSWLASAYVIYDNQVGLDDLKANSVCLRSTDNGYTWTYRGSIATYAQASSHEEGGTETALVKLANNDIVAMVRNSAVYRYRSVSSDTGATWSVPALQTSPMGGSSPQLLLLANGKLAMAVGFGNSMQIAFSTDGGSTWPDYFDLMAVHAQRVGATLVTTSYVALVEYTPNRLLAAYDRIPTGRDFQPNDGSLGPNQVWLADMAVR